MNDRHESLNSEVSAEEHERCPACGNLNIVTSERCSSCGQRLLPASIISITEVPHIGATGNDAEAIPRQPTQFGEPAAGESEIPSPAGGDLAQRNSEQQPKPQHMEEANLRYYFPPVLDGLLLHPAGLFRRAAALAADWIIISLLAMAVLHVAGMGAQLAELNRLAYTQGFTALAGSAVSEDLKAALAAIALIELALAVGMYTIFAVYGGSTPGMRLVGIRISRIDGADVTWKTAIFRALVLWAFIYFTAGFYLLIAGLYILIDPKGRSVHDIMTGTNVFLR